MHEKWELKQRQSLPLSAKINLSKERIRDWYEYWDGQVYVSFSGGKDSTVLLHLVRSIYPEVPAVFSDTGLEFPELREFVKTVDNVTIVRPEMSFRNVIQKYGYPIIGKKQARAIRDLQNPTTKNEATRNLVLTGYTSKGLYCPSRKLANKWVYLKDAPFKIGEQCCDVMKKNPVKKYEKETGRKSYVGTMAWESSMREQEWLKSGCNAYNAKRQQSKPISFWTEQDILKYIKDNNLRYASVYGDIIYEDGIGYYTTKESRTGCMFCGFGCQFDEEPNRFQRMKETHPKLYEYCMRDWDQGGLGLDEVLNYINIKH